MKNRKIQSIVALLILVTLTLGGLWSATAQGTRSGDVDQGLVLSGGAPGQFVPSEVLVKLKEGVSASSVHSLQSRYNAVYLQTLYGADVELWQVPEGEEQALVERLNADPAVEYAEPNYVYYAFGNGPTSADVTPNDPEFTKQWAHTQIHSAAAWDIGTGSAGVTIAIIDSGIDLEHPDLLDKIVPGYDFIDDDANPWDTYGHGTHVAGIAAASTNNGRGIAGMDWQARIMPVRTLGTDGSGPTSAIVNGINWAYQHGAQVLNLSLGGSGYSQTMQTLQAVG